MIMGTSWGTKESPKGLSERSSSVRLANEAKREVWISAMKGKGNERGRPKDSGSVVRLE